MGICKEGLWRSGFRAGKTDAEDFETSFASERTAYIMLYGRLARNDVAADTSHSRVHVFCKIGPSSVLFTILLVNLTILHALNYLTMTNLSGC